MREILIYNLSLQQRQSLLNWLCDYMNSKDYTTNLFDSKKEIFYLRFENEFVIPLWKKHWCGEIEFYELDTYNGLSIKIVGQAFRSADEIDFIKQELVAWFKENLQAGDYEETIMKDWRIRFMKKEEDMNLLRLIFGHRLKIEIKDYCDS